jgi:hypothetical protein
MDAASPKFTVITSEPICWIASYTASPEITEPPGQLIYKYMGAPGFSFDKY